MMTRKYGEYVCLLTVLAALSAIPVAAQSASTETLTYSYPGNPLAIFRDDANIITLVPITVPRGIKIEKVVATVDIEYPVPGDINLYLYSPDGTRTRLLERNCGDQGTLRRIAFDDSAPNKYSEFCPVEPGSTMRGNEPLSNYRDQNAAGLWLLAVENNGSNERVGWVLGYSLTITGQTVLVPTTSPELVVNAASLMGPGYIAPGEVISIYGTNLGPETPVSAANGDLPTTLGGTEVILNEQKGYIWYASRFRIDVQVPYALGVPGDVWLTVRRSGNESAPVNLKIATTKPGLFTIAGSGIGQLDAVNADGSLNKDQAAPRGTQVTVYASGLGWTLPLIPAGKAPGPQPTPSPISTVTASVGGVEATVVSARLVPDRPGVYAVSVLVPNSLSPGLVPVKIASAAAASQDGAYIRIR